MSLAGYRQKDYEVKYYNDGIGMEYLGTSHRTRAFFTFRLGIDF